MALVNNRTIIKLRVNFRLVISVVISFLTVASPLSVQAAVGNRIFAPYYWPSSSCEASYGSNTGANTGVDSDGSVWQSGLKEPFILEQYAVEVLKAVAKKRNVTPEDTVTQEHIDALLAFMFGEGGDINNRWLFNPLNSGLNSDELVSGGKKANGTQSFKSFDAGVEATARTIVGGNQSRLADVLVKKDSTAKEFMYALTYYKKFPGNKLWAEASVGNPGRYYNERLSLVNQVRRNYRDIASTVLGTDAREFPANIRNPSALRSGGGSTSPDTSTTASTTDGDSCGESSSSANGEVAGSIVQTAVNLAWPERWRPNQGQQDSNRKGPKTPKPEYALAINQYNKGQRIDGADCGVFVATVMRASQVDPDYPPVGTSIQLAYVRSHPEKYDIEEGPKSTADLLPGDILVVNNGKKGHTLIYVGPRGENGYDSASASLNSRSANLQPAGWENLSIYTRARLK